MKRPIALLLSLLLIVCLFSCEKGSESAIDEVTAPDGMPQPINPERVISDDEFVCTISISCASILDNTDDLDPEKMELIPSDGYIAEPTEVVFYGGESAFNVLRRFCKENKIHMEFSNTPIYNSAYIEGIGNIYEFDCGELSGWMYRVNDWFPNYGCSRYGLKNGDVIEFIYTCDLGKDVGGDFNQNHDE